MFIILIFSILSSRAAESKPDPRAKQKAKINRTNEKPKSTAAKPVEVTLGVTMMYGWWRPAYSGIDSGRIGNLMARSITAKNSGSFMLGPTLGIAIGNSWNIEATALFGVSRDVFRHSTLAMEANYLYLTIPSSMVDIYLDRGVMKARRYDSDISIEHSIHRYINLLIGIRFNYADAEGSSTRLLSQNPSRLEKTAEEYRDWKIGPSVGIGFQYSIRGFSLKFGASALFQGGVFYLKKSFINPLPAIINFMFIPDEYNLAYAAIGADAGIKLAYFIEKIRVEFWVGGRYVILSHISLFDIDTAYNAAYRKGWITGKVEQFGGITFGAGYKF